MVRLVGMGVAEVWEGGVRRERMEVSAALGFLWNSLRSEEPYAVRRAVLACLMVRRVAVRWAL